MYLPTNFPGSDCPPASTIISCQSDWQVSRISRVLSKFSAILSTVVYLRLVTYFSLLHDPPLSGDEYGHEWLHLFHQFLTMQALYVSRKFTARVASALKPISGEEVADAFSSLYLICLEDEPASSVEKFIAVRRLSGRPVSVVGTEVAFDQRLKPFVGK